MQDYDSSACESVKNITNAKVNIQDIEGEPVSFYSLSSNGDTVSAIRQELAPIVSTLTSGDILQIAGLTGVPFQAHVGNYIGFNHLDFFIRKID